MTSLIQGAATAPFGGAGYDVVPASHSPSPDSSAKAPLSLELTDISLSFGGIHALKSVSFDAMVLFAALTFVSLLERGVPFWLAIVVTLAVTTMLCFAIERSVLRPLTRGAIGFLENGADPMGETLIAANPIEGRKIRLRAISPHFIAPKENNVSFSDVVWASPVAECAWRDTHRSGSDVE